MTRHVGFSAISDSHAVVLVLGTLPGARSLEVGEYYANPRNVFWKIMSRLLAVDLEVPYASRVTCLKESGVALWDVLAAAQRPGSLDAAIVGSSAASNDFGRFLRLHPGIRLICFNGKRAADLYRRNVLPLLGDEFKHVRYETLPSTSPAHATLSFDQKLDRWLVVKEALGSNNRLQRAGMDKVPASKSQQPAAEPER
jgi:double-stranded uracil-DNA glycosylase